MVVDSHLDVDFLPPLSSLVGVHWKNKLEIVRPFVYAAMIHLACLVVVVCLGSGRLIVPHFDLVCCGVAVLAFFEREWLFQSVHSS